MNAVPEAPPMPNTAKEAVRGIMGTKLKVHTADGRLISGILTCLDKQGNIVLQHAAQHPEHSIEERHLGTVIVPKKQRMKTEAMVMKNEAAQLQAQMKACS